MAAGLADELKRELRIEPVLIPGSGGIFTVTVDGKTVFSKHETGRFPDPGEVVKTIVRLQSGNK